MSQATVMEAIATTFGGTLQTDPDGGQRRYTGGPIPVLGTLYDGFPEHFPASALFAGQDSGARFGALAIVVIEEPQEQRSSIGANGWWRVAHPVTIYFYHLAKGGHAEDARANIRDLQQSLRNTLRADTTLGSRVFSCGEADPQSTGAMGSGHRFKTGLTASAGGRHETRTTWQLTAVEFVQGGS
jgi:hypothetical protein